MGTKWYHDAERFDRSKIAQLIQNAVDEQFLNKNKRYRRCLAMHIYNRRLNEVARKYAIDQNNCFIYDKEAISKIRQSTLNKYTGY